MSIDDLSDAFGYTEAGLALPVVNYEVKPGVDQNTLVGYVCVVLDLIDERLPLTLTPEEAEDLAGALLRQASQARAEGLPPPDTP